MKVNKTILCGIIFIFLAGIIFLTDALNPFIRPVTYLFLMGSSKGKDIIFFGLLGLFLILSQIIKKDHDQKKYLKISIVLGSVLLISGIILEIIFRLNMGIGLNTVFCSMTNGMSSTSILHTHLIKSIFGEVLTQIMNPFIQSNINTGVGLYAYLPQYAFIIIFLIPILFITLALSMHDRPKSTTFLLAFFSSCLIIGIIDGGIFATPSYIGIFGISIIYRNEFYINYIFGTLLNDKDLLEKNKSMNPNFTNKWYTDMKFIFNDGIVLLILGLIILLRFTVAFAGAEPDYYTVDVVNCSENIDIGNISSHIIYHKHYDDLNKTTYHIDSDYNEMRLINDLKVPLNNSCEYYTVSWNIYSYLDLKSEIFTNTMD